VSLADASSKRPKGSKSDYAVDVPDAAEAPAPDVALRATPNAVDERRRRRRPGRRLFVSRRTIQMALGAVWVLDGALQLQPFMFTKGFAEQIVLPTANGQPAFVADPVHWASALILTHPGLWDALFAAIQLLIGAGMLFRRTVRPAIAVSIGWALAVWLLGEGLGGLASGASTFLDGAPGAVVLYAVLGMAAWPSLGEERRRLVLGPGRSLLARVGAIASRTADEPPARWVPAAWALVWSLFALLQALPVNSSGPAIGNQVTSSTTGAPSWVAEAQRSIAHALMHAGIVPVVAIVVIEMAIASLGVLPGRFRAVAAWTGIVAALSVWVVGQAFGQIPTGMGTDPNSAPLVALLGAALLGRVGIAGAGRAAARSSDETEPALKRGLRVA
jgi:hypothetical protein